MEVNFLVRKSRQITAATLPTEIEYISQHTETAIHEEHATAIADSTVTGTGIQVHQHHQGNRTFRVQWSSRQNAMKPLGRGQAHAKSGGCSLFLMWWSGSQSALSHSQRP